MLSDEHAYRAVKVDAELLHKCFGHMGMDCLTKTLKIVDGVTALADMKISACEPCIKAKIHKTPVNRESVKHAEELEELIYSDIWGPSRVQTMGGK